MDQKEIDIRSLDIVFFDCEMTGLTMAHELIEIGYVKVKAKTFEVISEGDIKIKPKKIHEADPAALVVNGYDDEEWAKDGVDLKTGLLKFLAVTDGCMLAGHNIASSDLPFLKKSLFEVGVEPNFFYKMLDTFPIAWVKLRGSEGLTRLSMDELTHYFGVDRGKAHRAIDDARATYQIFLKLLELWKSNFLQNDSQGTFFYARCFVKNCFKKMRQALFSADSLIIYTDGGSRGNPGPAAIGVVVGNRGYKQKIGEATNNMAEYRALGFALKKAKQLLGKAKSKQTNLHIKMDSQLIVKQMRAEYKIEDRDLQPIFLEIWNLRLDFKSVVFSHIPREQNKEADRLVNEALDS